jgi:rhamnose utilization protein RhaD (predicted bifunctional aldolase and dehydrogenase)/NAD(P)-dependent dehydrogenase (short-subunit alcohol dehydrogenase family)
MKNLWNDAEASAFSDDPLKLRAYSSRLLGQEPGLVLRGGGNTSLKVTMKNIFGEEEEILYIKGSGRDLETIQTDGFAALKLDMLRRLAALDDLSDIDLINMQKMAMTDQSGPNPSVEAILHAIIPYKFVDHTHADEIVTISNNNIASQLFAEIYQDRALIVPYEAAGFKLAKRVYDLTGDLDWASIDGIILLNHGAFTFGDDAKTSYDRMMDLASRARDYLKKRAAGRDLAKAEAREDLLALARIRKIVSRACGAPMIARLDKSQQACGFAGLPNVDQIAARGPMTADHIIRTKPAPAILREDVQDDIDAFVSAYQDYFNRYSDGRLAMLDPAPRWAIWPKYGTVAFGKDTKEANIVFDIVQHTIRAIQYGEFIGGWKPISQKHAFDMEYWKLQQAKLKGASESGALAGKVALVTGAASGIGLACAEALKKRGAVIVGLDLNPECALMFEDENSIGIACDIADKRQMQDTVSMAVRRFGGLDILISNAGIFTANQKIEAMDEKAWYSSMEINLSCHQRLLKTCIPYLKYGIDPAIVFVASKNVPAPGPGAAAYSVAKAGLTQLARVAAMELGADGIRVNIIHPDAVYDTALWTPEVLAARAKHYGMTVEDYKTKNILKTEVTSADVAELVCAMVGPAFAKITGAQIPIDGGNERVI